MKKIIYLFLDVNDLFLYFIIVYLLETSCQNKYENYGIFQNKVISSHANTT